MAANNPVRSLPAMQKKTAGSASALVIACMAAMYAGAVVEHECVELRRSPTLEARPLLRTTAVGRRAVHVRDRHLTERPDADLVETDVRASRWRCAPRSRLRHVGQVMGVHRVAAVQAAHRVWPPSAVG